MDLPSVTRRWHFRRQVPIRKIAQRTGLSRNTIRKYLRSNVTIPRFTAHDRPSKPAPVWGLHPREWWKFDWPEGLLSQAAARGILPGSTESARRVGLSSSTGASSLNG